MQKKICSIYKFTNQVNNKVYIGFTSQSPNQRYSCHKSNHKNPKHASYNYYFYKSMRKYGFENFVFEVIYQSYDNHHTLTVMEPYFILQYDSFNKVNGYNATKGGEGTLGRLHSQETKDKISQIVMSDIADGKRVPTKHSDEWRQKLRDDNAGGAAVSIPVVQFSPDGELIATYSSAQAAAKIIMGDEKYRGNLIGATEEVHRLYKGFYWRKATHEDSIKGCITNTGELKIKLLSGRHIRRTNKYILQYDINMNLIAEYTSIAKAVGANKPTSSETLVARCGDGRLYKNCYWKFREVTSTS